MLMHICKSEFAYPDSGVCNSIALKIPADASGDRVRSEADAGPYPAIE